MSVAPRGKNRVSEGMDKAHSSISPHANSIAGRTGGFNPGPLARVRDDEPERPPALTPFLQ